MSQGDFSAFPEDERNPYAPPKSAIRRDRSPTGRGPIGMTLGDVVAWTWEIYRERMGAVIGVVLACGAMMFFPMAALGAILEGVEGTLKPDELASLVEGVAILAVLLFGVWI